MIGMKIATTLLIPGLIGCIIFGEMKWWVLSNLCGFAFIAGVLIAMCVGLYTMWRS